jgi:putative GTP pyrophosphokinase
MKKSSDESKHDVDRVLQEFDKKKDDLTTLAQKTKTLIEEILKDGAVQFQSIQTRVKSREKLKDKYLDPRKEYRRLDDITDQVGIRIITYYEDEIERVTEIVKREFVIDPENSVDKRETEPDKFGYYALNYICKYLPERTSHVEYKKFANVWFEIQITSILRHAWAEIEHPWYDLKGAFPDNIKRRFARVAALLEIAEEEFRNLRKLQSDYQQSVAVQVEADVTDLPVDAVSLKSFIEHEPLVAELDRQISSIRGRPLGPALSDRFAQRRAGCAVWVGMKTLQDVHNHLMRYRNALLAFARRRHQEASESRIAILPPGVCIQQLSNMLAYSRGKKDAAEYLKANGMVMTDTDIERAVAIAKEIMAQYGT